MTRCHNGVEIMTDENHNDMWSCIEFHGDSLKERANRRVDEDLKVNVHECECGRLILTEVWHSGTGWEELDQYDYDRETTVEEILSEYGL